MNVVFGVAQAFSVAQRFCHTIFISVFVAGFAVIALALLVDQLALAQQRQRPVRCAANERERDGGCASHRIERVIWRATSNRHITEYINYQIIYTRLFGTIYVAAMNNDFAGSGELCCATAIGANSISGAPFFFFFLFIQRILGRVPTVIFIYCDVRCAICDLRFAI